MVATGRDLFPKCNDYVNIVVFPVSRVYYCVNFDNTVSHFVGFVKHVKDFF